MATIKVDYLSQEENPTHSLIFGYNDLKRLTTDVRGNKPAVSKNEQLTFSWSNSLFPLHVIYTIKKKMHTNSAYTQVHESISE